MLCQTFTVFQLLFVCESFYLSFAFNNWKAALLGGDQVTDMATEEYPILIVDLASPEVFAVSYRFILIFSLMKFSLKINKL